MQQTDIAGEIDYFNLTNWWISRFKPDEREYIEELYGAPTIIDDSEDEPVYVPRPLTQGSGGKLFDTPVQLIANIAESLGTSSRDRDLRRRLLDKAEELLTAEKAFPIEGEIRYFKLTDWWLSTFSAEERRRVDALCGGALTHGTITRSSQSATSMLIGTAFTLESQLGQPHLVERLLSKGEELARQALAKFDSIEVADRAALDLHFLYSNRIGYYYRHRADPAALAAAIAACEKQIEIAPRAAMAFKNTGGAGPLSPTQPTHIGFRQLAIIREKQGDYGEALRLSEEGKKQGWNDHWNDRIARLTHKRRK